ncbi:MAG TPA: PPK2 family polyphosphate kinase [Acidimicrobiales bacterium]
MDERVRFIRQLTAALRIAPGRAVELGRDLDPASTDGSVARSDAARLLDEGVELLSDYQARLYAEASSSVLLVLQGSDASGKDGTIKHVMRGINPQGVDVRSFGQPSAEELAHDFLWRCQRVLPERGRIGVFNRSYYEEVLVVRIHPELLVPQHLPELPGDQSIWARRYREINEWERYLVDNGTRVVKIFLNLSRREQAKRFLKRIDDPRKHWKFSPADLRDRRRWDDYQLVYNDMLSHTSTEWAPWYIVPADRKWFARLATAAVVAETLLELDPRYPEVQPDARQQMAEARSELTDELRRSKAASKH